MANAFYLVLMAGVIVAVDLLFSRIDFGNGWR